MSETELQKKPGTVNKMATTPVTGMEDSDF